VVNVSAFDRKIFFGPPAGASVRRFVASFGECGT
jgi:hypothetical protein